NYAKIATSPEDVLIDLGLADKDTLFPKEEETTLLEDETDAAIYEVITSEPKHIDVISEELKLDISDLLYRLLNMEFKGFIKQLPGKYYIRVK
ncbi:MAG: DNA-protecting protein DprA, partial [Candidatus Kapaibacteriota bacterium]